MKHILIVDDEKLIRYSLSALFQNSDTEVIALGEGKAAVKAVGDWPFDFCFLDLHLPDMNGIDIMKTIRLVSPRTKIILMTGSEVDEAGMRAIRENAYLFLMKPFNLRRIKRLLETVASGDENAYRELDALEARLGERRGRSRRKAERPVTFTIAGTAGEREHAYSADLVDISDTGTRIRTHYRLEPGAALRFSQSGANAEGVVRWSARDEERKWYVSGIQFVPPKQRS